MEDVTFSQRLTESILKYVVLHLHLTNATAQETESITSENPLTTKFIQLFDKYVPLLRKFLCDNEQEQEHQLACLKQIEQFVHLNKMPKGNNTFVLLSP
jgi:type VI protein secretion system component Hcp